MPDRIFQLGLYQHVRHRYMVGVKRFIHICLVNKLIAETHVFQIEVFFQLFELRRERRKVFIGVFHYISHQAGIGGKILIRLQLIILGNKLIHTIQAVEDEMRIHLTAQRLEGYLFILPSDGIPGFDDKHEKNKDQDNRADQYIVEGVFLSDQFVFQDTFFLQLGDTGFMCLKEFLVYQCAVRFNQRFQFFHKVCI